MSSLQQVDHNVMSTDLLRVHSIPLSVVPAKLLNSTSANTHPWGHHLSLISIWILSHWLHLSRVQPSSQCLIHSLVHLSSAWLLFGDKDVKQDTVICCDTWLSLVEKKQCSCKSRSVSLASATLSMFANAFITYLSFPCPKMPPCKRIAMYYVRLG